MSQPLVVTSRTSRVRQYLRDSWRVLLKELSAFGLVGTLGFTVDEVLFNVFFHDGQIIAKTISTTAATVVTYVGNRYFSFSHRARSGIRRETTIFFGINLIVLVLSLLILGFCEYPLHLKHHRLAMNLVNIGTIGLGTIFRFWSYKRFVFLHPDRVHSHDVDLEAELAE